MLHVLVCAHERVVLYVSRDKARDRPECICSWLPTSPDSAQGQAQAAQATVLIPWFPPARAEDSDQILQDDPCLAKTKVVGDVQYCDRYWECEFGEPELYDCPNGLVWVGKNQGIADGCDYPWRHSNICNQKDLASKYQRTNKQTNERRRTDEQIAIRDVIFGRIFDSFIFEQIRWHTGNPNKNTNIFWDINM